MIQWTWFITKAYLVAVVLVVLLFSAGVGHAATATWTNPTDADLAGVNLYRAPGPCATPGAFAKVDSVQKPATSEALPNPTADGIYCHKATAYDTAGNESVFSNTAEFTYNIIPPGAPQGFIVKP